VGFSDIGVRTTLQVGFEPIHTKKTVILNKATQYDLYFVSVLPVNPIL